MVRGSQRYKLIRIRYGANVNLHIRAILVFIFIIALNGSWIPAIRSCFPWVMCLVIAAINVIPAGIHQHAIIINGGMPFIGFVMADARNTGTISVHGMQGIIGTGPFTGTP